MKRVKFALLAGLATMLAPLAAHAQDAIELMAASVNSGIYVLENAHRAFLRAVGGFLGTFLEDWKR